MEENIDALAAKAGALALRNTRAFMFLEGRDPAAERAFREIARLTGGVILPFDRNAADELRALLGAVATYAAGGRAGARGGGHRRARDGCSPTCGHDRAPAGRAGARSPCSGRWRPRLAWLPPRRAVGGVALDRRARRSPRCASSRSPLPVAAARVGLLRAALARRGRRPSPGQQLRGAHRRRSR